MNNPPLPPLKSLPDTPDRPGFAEPSPAPSGSGAPKVVAVGVLSVLRPDQRQRNQRDQERVFFGLHIVAEPEWRIAVTAACPCGYRRHGKGRAAGVPLIEDYTSHKKACAHHTSSTDRRAA
ncbi:hypothetical protein ACWGGS_16060 [Streptomyces decoyicus]